MKEHIKGQIGEEIVNKIANLTFFNYWCYPSPEDENGNNKEICDLLIIFKDVVFIISVKNYEFKGNYERYFNKTLKKAISQISGAERKLFKNNRKVIFTHPNNGKFLFDPTEYNHVYRIIVNHSNFPCFYPGTAYTKMNKIIHIFNWEAFYKTLKELDTVSDLISYIVARSNLFYEKKVLILNGADDNWNMDTGKQLDEYMNKHIDDNSTLSMIAGTELDILSVYLSNQRSFPFNLNDSEVNAYFYDLEGEWKDYIQRVEVERKKEADTISYVIDEFIDRDILYYNDEQRRSIASEILSLTRYERRLLGLQFNKFLKKHFKCANFNMARSFGTYGKVVIGFFIHGNGISLERCMQFMSIATQGYAHYEGYKSEKTILIGTNATLTQWKFVFDPEVQRPSPKEEEDLLHNLGVLGWFTNINKSKIESDEYPS